MTVFTVHEPRPRKNETVADPDRYVFVRDGFYFWAFLFGPLWMLWRRLWLVLVMFLILTAAVQAALWALGVSGPVKFAVGFLIAILIGCEAGTLRRWSLRRRWTNVGLVVAPIMPVPDWQEGYRQLVANAATALDGVPNLDLTVELITHRFTPGSKDTLQGWYPGSSLEMDEAQRSRKLTKFGSTKWVYPAAMMRDLRDTIERALADHLPAARILYWT